VGSDAGLAGDIYADVSAPAVPGAAGDLLVLRVRMVAGTTGYLEFSTNLTIP
jgi:hypothetical protein